LKASLALQGILLIRLITAGLCGAAIGYERKNRLKEAGIRTHMLVAIGSCLLILISQYGFSDLVKTNGYNFDPSRIAAQIVTGIGFLGAGMIFVKKQTINGLTTAAGIWTTAGIGMAIGTGMYIVGIVSTAFVFIIQTLLHKNFAIIKLPSTKQIFIEAECKKESVEYIKDELSKNGIEIINIKAEKTEEQMMNMELYLKIPAKFEYSQLLNMFAENDDIRLIDY